MLRTPNSLGKRTKNRRKASCGNNGAGNIAVGAEVGGKR
jgi:hypothetical protein